MDYVDGKLLVDPKKRMKDGYGVAGSFMAMCAGRFIEKTWVRFKPTCSRQNVVAALVGAVITFFLVQMLGVPMEAFFGMHWGYFAKCFILTLFIMTIWPAVMKAALKDETVSA